MSDVKGYDFDREKQLAAQRLRELGARSKYRQAGKPPQNSAAGNNGDETSRPKSDASADFLSKFNLPFLSETGGDSDMALILGLILILSAEKADKLLLLALLYILI